ncbi:MAG: threonine synthase [Acidobacteriota bacterium]
MSYVSSLQCSSCLRRYPPNRLLNLCTCGKPLLVRYDLDRIQKSVAPGSFLGRVQSMWRYHELLPVPRLDQAVSLGEGFTPLIEAARLARAIGLAKLWIKDESVNPTASFKARGLSAAVSMARLLRAQILTIPSAGNAAGALAAYAARAGMEAHIFMPRDVPPSNRIECEQSGAHVTLVDGLITDCGAIVAEKSRTEGWFDVSTLKEPYRIEGKKTLGLELAEQLGWRLPDVIIYPTGGGTGLIGMWKAFEEMEALGWIDSRRPRMVSVQAAGCAPIVEAFHAGKREADPWPDAGTIASGLRVPRAIGDFLMLDILRSSRGAAIAVSDDEMRRDVGLIARSEGLFVSPEGAATLSGARKLLESGFLSPQDEVVLFNTGSGLKYLHLFS